MAKKILGGVGSLLGLKKKKKAAEPAAAAPAATEKRWTPIIKQLGSAPTNKPGILAAASRRGGLIGNVGTILSDKLGG